MSTSVQATTTHILEALGEVLQRSVDPSLASVRFDDLGLDSLEALRLAASLEDRLAIPVGLELIYDHPTARDLAAALFPSGQ